MKRAGAADIIAILRKFHVADDQHLARHIERLTLSHPAPHNTLASFRFAGSQWHLLYDDSAADDLAHLGQQLAGVGQPTGQWIDNPHDHATTYGLPFKGKDVYLFQVVPVAVRLDSYLARQYPEHSRSSWQKYLAAGLVRVNGQVVTAAKTMVDPTDIITATPPPRPDLTGCQLPVIYQDAFVTVIDKPAGILTHAKGPLNYECSVAEYVRPRTQYQADGNRPGIVHRLDRDTSGVIITAHDEPTARLLARQFAQRRTKKTYLAVVDGRPRLDAALIDLPIGRHPTTPSTFRVDPGGKPAQTRYTVLASNGRHSLLRLQPTTGRTHQLRVHLAHIGTPIHGDRLYGRAADRLYLHAAELEITIPSDQGNQRRRFVAPTPDGFGDLAAPEVAP